MPLASIVQVPFMALFGDVAWASALPFALIGAIAAPLTWAIARDFGARSRVAVGAGILTAIPLLSAVYLVQPDNFSLFQPLVIGSLWLGARALRGSSTWAFVGAGLLAGLATLSRNDGLLVLAALGLAFAWDRWRAWRSAGARAAGDLVRGGRRLRRGRSHSSWPRGGRASWPSSGRSRHRRRRARSCSSARSRSGTASRPRPRSAGCSTWGSARCSRRGSTGLIAAVMIYITLVAGVVLAPFMLIGGWARRRSRDFGPFFIYAGLLFAFSAIVSAVHVPGGTFIHSAIALAPFSYILALEGVDVAVQWVARRRSSWDAASGEPDLHRRGRRRSRSCAPSPGRSWSTASGRIVASGRSPWRRR